MYKLERVNMLELLKNVLQDVITEILPYGLVFVKWNLYSMHLKIEHIWDKKQYEYDNGNKLFVFAYVP